MWIRTAALTGLAAFLAAAPLRAEPGIARYLGAQSCSASSCHGGAGERRDQWIQWNSGDVHRRSAATLTLARSAQIATAAGLADPVHQSRCTVCHAPFAGVPVAERLGELDRSEGVSCESCHAPAEGWVRSHTRTERDGFTYRDKIAAGLRDLRNPYVRANTCVACHLNVDRDLLQAGHPELIFELDGQTLGEPRHWKEAAGFSAPRAWWVGQAVALREVSWQLSRPGQADDRLKARQGGLRWIVERTESIVIPGGKTLGAASEPAAVQSAADERARAGSTVDWPPSKTAALLHQLAATAPEFRDAGVSHEIHARRGEGLVLALDRLLAGSDPTVESGLEPELKELFRLAQSLPEFDPARFAAGLEKFATRLGGKR